MKNCLLCGVGGQGTVLASKIIAYASLEKGELVRTAETIGMAQRGGCVVSHVRCGKEIHSPLIPKGGADVIIAFELAEAVRSISYLKKDGVLVVNKQTVKPVTDTLGDSSYKGEEMIEYLKENYEKVVFVDGEEICVRCGSTKVLNIIMLAAAISTGNFWMTMDELKDSVKNRVNPKFQDINLKAIQLVEDMY